MRFPLFERHPREELSGYLDKELVFPRVEAVEAHLSSCPTCRAEMDALRALKAQLAALPEAAAPRSFALTPAMAQRPAPEPARVRTPARVAALSNGMRLAGAGMAVALAAIMVLNFSGSGSSSDSGDDSAGQALAIPEAHTTDTSAYYSNDSDAGALSVPSAAPSAAAENPASTAKPPDNGVVGGTTGNAPDAPGAGVSSRNNGATSSPGTTPLPQAGEDGVPVPDATDLTGKTVTDAGAARTDATEPPVIKSLQTDQPAPEAARDASPESDGGGVDILLLVAIALAAGVVLAFAGSVLIPRIARDDQ